MSFCPEQNISDPNADWLGTKPFAVALAETIQKVRAPFTIGLVGDWGSGKTFIANQAKRVLEEQWTGRQFCVTFEAWKYDSGVNLLYPMVHELAKSARLNPTLTKALKESADQLLDRVFAVAGGWGADFLEHKLGIKTDSKTVAERAKRGKLDRVTLSEWTDKVDELQQAVSDFCMTLLVAGEFDKIVIFVDDLDRCSPITAVELLEFIRLHFHVDSVVFVLAVSTDVIADGIAAKYGQDANHARQFLDKLINLEFRVPEPRAEVHDYAQRVTALALETPDDSARNITGHIASSCVLLGRANPRFIKKMCNRAILVREILAAAGMGELTQERCLWMVFKAGYPVEAQLVLEGRNRLALASQYKGTQINDSDRNRLLGMGGQAVSHIANLGIAADVLAQIDSALRSLGKDEDAIERLARLL